MSKKTKILLSLVALVLVWSCLSMLAFADEALASITVNGTTITNLGITCTESNGTYRKASVSGAVVTVQALTESGTCSDTSYTSTVTFKNNYKGKMYLTVTNSE